MKSACVGVLSIIELKNARWNIKIDIWVFFRKYVEKFEVSLKSDKNKEFFT